MVSAARCVLGSVRDTVQEARIAACTETTSRDDDCATWTRHGCSICRLCQEGENRDCRPFGRDDMKEMFDVGALVDDEMVSRAAKMHEGR